MRYFIFLQLLLACIHPANAQNWNTLGNYTLNSNGSYKFIERDGHLYIGGLISFLNDETTSGIVVWNGESISPISSLQGVGPYDFCFSGDSIMS